MKIEKIKSKQSMPKNAKKVFEGKLFDVYQWEQEMFDGSKKIFEKVRKIDSTVVIAFTEDKKILVLKQEQPSKGKYMSLPGGMIERNDEPMQTAERELLEETGYVAGELKLWHSHQFHDKAVWNYFYFIAKGCCKVAQQNLDAGGEKIEVMEMELDDFLDMLLRQEIKGSEIVMRMIKEDLIVMDREKTYEKIKNYFNN
jgi:ADP-ribose pyrophosphatase